MSSIFATPPADLIALPEKSLTEKFLSLHDPWQESDTATRTDILALTEHVLRSRAPAAERHKLERALLAALQFPGNPVNRAFLVQQLETLRSSAAVPALAKLLSDPDLIEPAACALSVIGGRPAQQALVAALPRADARQLTTLLAALARLPEGMTNVALPYTKHADRDVRLMALLILSRTGDPRAAEPLRRVAFGEPSYEQHQALAFFSEYAARLPRDKAVALAKELLQNDDGICVGLTLLRDPATLKQHLNHERADVRHHAFRLLAGMPDTDWLGEVIAKGPEDLREPAIQRVMTLPRPRAEPLLRQALAGSDAAARREAAKGLLMVTGKSALPELLAQLKREEARAAFTETLLETTRSRELALQLARDDDAGVRRVAWQQLATVAVAADLPALFDLALSQNDAAAGSAMVKAALRLNQQTPAVQHLAAKSEELVLGWLAGLGGKTALETVAARNGLPAVRVLSYWKTDDALPYLMKLAKSAASETERVLAFRGAARLAEKNAAVLKELLELAPRPEEKELVQAALNRLEEKK